MFPPLLRLLHLVTPENIKRESWLSFASLQHPERRGTWSFSPAPPVTEGLVWPVVRCRTCPVPPWHIATAAATVIITTAIIIMDSVMRVKRSLSAPIKKLSSCVSSLKGRRLRAKGSARYRRGRGRKAKKGSNRLSRTPPPSHRNPQPVILRSYQADLEKQRQVAEHRRTDTSWNDVLVFQKMWKSLVVLCRHRMVTVWGACTLFLQRINLKKVEKDA